LLGASSRMRLMRSFATFQQAYLTRTLSRLNDPINQMFPTSVSTKQVPSVIFHIPKVPSALPFLTLEF
jgi:hypothetical protein